ncbi:phage tail tube protein [Magnetospirillum fulvum]|uniref:Phage tail tube protein n=1 Tax=Magnetospirillum fulvum MGU-K5 TaxID=1316936 RepID=S9TGG8_MAGFU|nr:phage tail tube protein [Magnetospirillum fulvum]EPY01381.1 hypothetical protein K678_11306 [Magnetospirillum fulvum MGU-K5]
MTTVAGVLGVDLGGTSFACEESATYNTQTRAYKGIKGGKGFLGVEGEGVIPFIEVTIRLDEGQASDAVQIKGETVILRCEDRTVTLTKGWLDGAREVDGAKNSIKCKFVGPACTEVF